mmetsp:Transcript_45290/g.79892  ORF Transcript_45290/g.79892 Transcript_45290/m.79892 type:complete len:103 (-) Transcript_45290:8-316(-)
MLARLCTRASVCRPPVRILQLGFDVSYASDNAFHRNLKLICALPLGPSAMLPALGLRAVPSLEGARADGWNVEFWSTFFMRISEVRSASAAGGGMRPISDRM